MIKKALDASSNNVKGRSKPPTAPSATVASSKRAYARVTNKAAAKQKIYRSPLSTGAFPQQNFPKRLSVPASRAQARRAINGSGEVAEDEMTNFEA